MKAPDGRKIFVWRGAGDTSRLVEAVAEAGCTEIFESDGALVWHRDGQTSGVARATMREIVTKLISTVRLVEHEGVSQVEFYPFDFPIGADTSKEPDQSILSILQNDLIPLVAKAPSTPVRLTARQQQEIMDRLKTGEPQARIADAYGVDRDTIRRLAGAG